MLKNYLDETLRVKNFTFDFTINNNGPSNIEELEVFIQIPTIFISASHNQIRIVDSNQIEVKASHGNKILDIRVKTSKRFGDLQILTETGELAHQLFKNNSDQILNNLPADRTIFLNCKNKKVQCSDLILIVKEFEAQVDPIKITATFSIDFSKIGEYLKNIM